MEPRGEIIVAGEVSCLLRADSKAADRSPGETGRSGRAMDARGRVEAGPPLMLSKDFDLLRVDLRRADSALDISPRAALFRMAA